MTASAELEEGAVGAGPGRVGAAGRDHVAGDGDEQGEEQGVGGAGRGGGQARAPTATRRRGAGRRGARAGPGVGAGARSGRRPGAHPARGVDAARLLPARRRGSAALGSAPTLRRDARTAAALGEATRHAPAGPRHRPPSPTAATARPLPLRGARTAGDARHQADRRAGPRLGSSAARRRAPCRRRDLLAAARLRVAVDGAQQRVGCRSAAAWPPRPAPPRVRRVLGRRWAQAVRGAPAASRRPGRRPAVPKSMTSAIALRAVLRRASARRSRRSPARRAAAPRRCESSLTAKRKPCTRRRRGGRWTGPGGVRPRRRRPRSQKDQ